MSRRGPRMFSTVSRSLGSPGCSGPTLILARERQRNAIRRVPADPTIALYATAKTRPSASFRRSSLARGRSVSPCCIRSRERLRTSANVRRPGAMQTPTTRDFRGNVGRGSKAFAMGYGEQPRTRGQESSEMTRDGEGVPDEFDRDRCWHTGARIFDANDRRHVGVTSSRNPTRSV